ncbi:MAG: NEW3 domain-containing protein, partial [Chitinophagaceae bacterium]
IELSTPTGLLSTHITAGGEKDIALVVKNTGSASLKNISLSSQTPADWGVTFSPAKIDEIDPGATSQVTAQIKASKEAIAGDYATTLTATTPEASSNANFRVSVRTSMLWGWIGVIIIILALLSVYYLFRKYGRR